jgi:ABC-type uncharacterized transport system ATPase subunit
VIVAVKSDSRSDIRDGGGACRLRDGAAAGAAVIVYSSDLDEVLALATRVAACTSGGCARC